MARMALVGTVEAPVSLQRLRPAMGTWVAIEASAATASAAAMAIAAAYRRVLEIAQQLHPSREASELARINSGATGTRVPISSTTWELLRLARSVHEASEGVFDPCLPSRPGRLGDLRLSAADEPSKWALCQAPLLLDLGGIGKGYAVDEAIAALRAAGCSGALVNAGGDVRLYGRSHSILLRHGDGTCVPLILEDEALAVSELISAAGHRPPEHRGYYSRVGGAPPVRPYAAVRAPSAVIADALTKCVLLAGRQSAARALRAFGARLAA